MWEDKKVELQLNEAKVLGTLEFKGSITPEQAERFRKEWEASLLPNTAFNTFQATSLPTVRFVRKHPAAVLPTKGTEGAVGWDVYACQDVYIPAGATTLVPTGWNIAVPYGYEVQVRPRSGLSLKGITVMNSPGTVDPDYRGSLGVIMYNGRPSDEDYNGYQVSAGDRIAQLVVAPVTHAAMLEVEAFDDETARGTGGYGSTGK